MCDRRLHDDPVGLKCRRQDPHTTGCVFESTSVADGHTASEDAAEVTRG